VLDTLSYQRLIRTVELGESLFEQAYPQSSVSTPRKVRLIWSFENWDPVINFDFG
jgi:hypothetical protein